MRLMGGGCRQTHTLQAQDILQQVPQVAWLGSHGTPCWQLSTSLRLGTVVQLCTSRDSPGFSWFQTGSKTTQRD